MAIDLKKLQEIQSLISKRGQNPVIGTIYQQMPVWLSWYRGNVNDFHRYSVYTMYGQNKTLERKTLNMAKKVCEDWAKLLFGENTQLTVDEEEINYEVHKVLDDNNFNVDFRNFVEKYFAMGTGATVEFIDENEIVIDYIIGDMLIITSYRNSKVNGLCTVNEFQEGDEWITHLTFHHIKKDIYTIRHEVYVSEDKTTLGNRTQVSRIIDSSDLNEEDSIVYETKIPHFQVFKPNITNNYDIDSPMGISVFANAIDNLKSADNKYDSFDNEYELARHRIMVDVNSASQEIQKVFYDYEGNPKLSSMKIFDTKERVYVGADLSGNKNSIEIYNAPIRATEHIDGINNDVQRTGFNCGMGTDYYAFDARGVYQNEKAIVSENSDLWISKKNHEKILIKGLTDLLKSIVFLLRETGVIAGDIEKLEYIVKPDDSIIIDDEAQYQKDLDLNERGAMPLWKILVKWFGLTEEKAKQQIAEADEERGGNLEELIDEELNNPVPKPVSGETREEFISRFMSDDKMMEEYPDEKQRRAIAEETWMAGGS